MALFMALSAGRYHPDPPSLSLTRRSFFTPPPPSSSFFFFFSRLCDRVTVRGSRIERLMPRYSRIARGAMFRALRDVNPFTVTNCLILEKGNHRGLNRVTNYLSLVRNVFKRISRNWKFKDFIFLSRFSSVKFRTDDLSKRSQSR